MNRPKNPTERIGSKKNQPSSKKRQRDNPEEFERTIPGRRTPTIEKQHDRIVNEDEQLKAVNHREDNAQTRYDKPTVEVNPPAAPLDNENERLEAGDDNSEVHPRPPKVN